MSPPADGEEQVRVSPLRERMRLQALLWVGVGVILGAIVLAVYPDHIGAVTLLYLLTAAVFAAVAVVATVRARSAGGSWDSARSLETGDVIAPAGPDIVSLLPLVLVGLAGALTQNGAVIITLGGFYLGLGVAWLFRLAALGGWQERTGRRLLVRQAPPFARVERLVHDAAS